MKTKAITGLYAITSQTIVSAEESAYTQAIRDVINGGCRVLQYRDKNEDYQRRAQQAAQLVALCQDASVASIINDDVALAVSVGADGVHIGQHDASVIEARAVMGADAIIGVSCYNRLDDARRAAQQGADYIALGSMYPSGTKPDAVRASLDLVRQASQELKVPVVTIGGINVMHVPELYEAGASAIAVISALFDAPDIGAAAREFSETWSRCEQV